MQPGTPRWPRRVGIAVSIVPAFMLIMSAVMKLTHNPQVVEGFSAFGFPASTITPIGAVELACAILYLIPQTAVLGAVLITGYIGGAVATHVHAGDPFMTPAIVAVLAWAGLYLRDSRVRALLPLRR